jgi:arylsulfatase A-like enzyme
MHGNVPRRAQPSPPCALRAVALRGAGYGDAGYLSTGSPHGKLLTPNLDKAVAEGMSFTEAYAGAPVCAPSRCTLMTGRHSGHATVRDNGPIMGANDTGVATVLKTAGYDTAHIGKWGLGDIGSTGDPIVQGGFDIYFGQTDQAYCHNYYPDHMNVGPNEYAFVLVQRTRQGAARSTALPCIGQTKASSTQPVARGPCNCACVQY